jgi:hypothetical protein
MITTRWSSRKLNRIPGPPLIDLFLKSVANIWEFWEDVRRPIFRLKSRLTIEHFRDRLF